jgi:hypothetical protein
VHFKGLREAAASGKSWVVGLHDPSSLTGLFLRHDLGPPYVDASLEEHLFLHILPTSGDQTLTDAGTFGPGPGLDVTFGWYGATMHVDVSRNGEELLRREIDTALLPASMHAYLASFSGADITIDDLIAGAP